ncbi:MAG: trimeric intracellular cation channel family protein [Natronosporangium sp.]
MSQPEVAPGVAELVSILDLTGVAANALVGAAVARGLQIDVVGFLALGIVSGLGGGLLRDTLLQHGTPVALTNYLYLPVALGAALVAFLLRLEGRLWDTTYVLVDALALGCWAAAGAQLTLTVGLGWLPAVLLGTITAVGGGMLRDILVQRRPQVFERGPLYAVCAAVASGVLVVLTYLGYAPLGTVAAVLVGSGLCLLSRWHNWQAPVARSWQLRLPRSGPRGRGQPGNPS